MMQTASVTLTNSQDNATKVQLISDSGSQQSYITKQVAVKLKFPYESIEKLSVVTFGNDKSKTISCRLSTLKVHLKDKTFMTMRVTVIPNITGKINRIPIDAKDIEFLVMVC